MGDVVDFNGGVMPPEGGGGAVVPAKAKKEKPVDWGVINRLSENFYLIYGTDTVYDNEAKRIMTMKSFRILFGDAVKFWLASPSRKMVLPERIEFDPTYTGHVIDEDAAMYFDNSINLFTGLEISRKAGPCDLILAHLLRLCGGDEAMRDWLLRWVAYPFQHPGAKMRTSVIMHGEEGTGKNIFWEEIVSKLYGRYAVVITQTQIEENYTGWISQKMFAVADEVVSQAEKRHVKGRLKQLISGTLVPIREMYMPTRWEKNFLNLVFLSNEIEPLKLDMGDRRYCVVWCDDVPDKAYFNALAAQMDNGGIAAFYDYLLKLDLGDFNEHTKPLINEAKKDLIQLGLSPVRKFFEDWEGELLPVPFTSARAQDLYKAFTKYCHENGERYLPTATAFGREISRVIPKVENVKLAMELNDWQGHLYEPIPPPPECITAPEIKKHRSIDAMNFAQKLNDWSK
jgi:putative DNA primase/helicase